MNDPKGSFGPPFNRSGTSHQSHQRGTLPVQTGLKHDEGNFTHLDVIEPWSVERSASASSGLVVGEKSRPRHKPKSLTLSTLER
jgi:hypothetical protein